MLGCDKEAAAVPGPGAYEASHGLGESGPAFTIGTRPAAANNAGDRGGGGGADALPGPGEYWRGGGGASGGCQGMAYSFPVAGARGLSREEGGGSPGVKSMVAAACSVGCLRLPERAHIQLVLPIISRPQALESITTLQLPPACCPPARHPPWAAAQQLPAGFWILPVTHRDRVTTRPMTHHGLLLPTTVPAAALSAVAGTKAGPPGASQQLPGIRVAEALSVHPRDRETMTSWLQRRQQQDQVAVGAQRQPSRWAAGGRQQVAQLILLVVCLNPPHPVLGRISWSQQRTKLVQAPPPPAARHGRLAERRQWQGLMALQSAAARAAAVRGPPRTAQRMQRRSGRFGPSRGGRLQPVNRAAERWLQVMISHFII